MRVILQNVLNANVKIDNEVVGQINRGFLLLVGFTFNDTKEVVEKIAHKITSLRVFEDENGKTNLSLKDVDGQILSVSQFTLYGSVKDGRRPSFVNALRPTEANELYEYFNEILRNDGFHVETGHFGVDMKVNLINDGPFTLIIDSEDLIK